MLAIILVSFLISTAKTDSNLAIIPVDYSLNLAGQVLVTDPSFEHTPGYPSIRLDPTTQEGNNPNRECYSKRIPINVGDNIVFSCYIKTSETRTLYHWGGARIGIDFYDNKGSITAIQSDGQHGYYPNEDAESQAGHYVEWGSNGWTLRIINFTVPGTMRADGYLGHPFGGTYTPTSIILWLQVWDSNGAANTGVAWFADSKLTINPTTDSSATFKPTLSTTNSYNTPIYLMAFGLGIVMLFETGRIVKKVLERTQIKLLLLELERWKQKFKSAIKRELECIFSRRLFKQ